MAFKCNHCGFDLSVRMDLLALAIKADYPDDELPNDLALDGTCDSCGSPFNYSGEFFSHYLRTKVEEGVIGPETSKYGLVALDVSGEEHEEFKRLAEAGDGELLHAFVKQLFERSEFREPSR